MQIEHFKGFSVQNGDMKIKVNLDRFSEQFAKAQYQLDTEVMKDMIPYMPQQTGALINLTQAESAAIAGTGRVCAAAPPYGRYLYMGKVMVDAQTGRGASRIQIAPNEYIFRHRKGATLVATGRDLTYSNPRATSRWFETAKRNHGDTWIKNVKATAGGG